MDFSTMHRLCKALSMLHSSTRMPLAMQVDCLPACFPLVHAWRHAVDDVVFTIRALRACAD